MYRWTHIRYIPAHGWTTGMVSLPRVRSGVVSAGEKNQAAVVYDHEWSTAFVSHPPMEYFSKDDPLVQDEGQPRLRVDPR